jgi:hypothetical protein
VGRCFSRFRVALLTHRPCAAKAFARRPSRLWSWLALLFVLAAGAGRAATLEQDIATALDQIRAIRAEHDAKTIADYNKQMDAAWQLFLKNKTQALPILRGELRAELGRDKASDLLLLDVGFFLYKNDAADGKAVAREALSKIDLQASIIKANDKELFEFLHALAEDHDALVLPLIERTFLSGDAQIFVPRHALTLDGTMICVFLYGAYGADAEDVLRTKLADKAVAKRVLEILVWLGSPAALPEVREAMINSPDYDTFARSAAYMMHSAGPAGRSTLLALDPQRLDPQSRNSLAEARKTIEEMSFESSKARFANLPGDGNLPDAEMSARLDAMFRNYGKDDSTSPLAILNSGLSAESLIAKLTSIRSRMLFRISDEALYDVQITNVLINTLRYREK